MPSHGREQRQIRCPLLVLERFYPHLESPTLMTSSNHEYLLTPHCLLPSHWGKGFNTGICGAHNSSVHDAVFRAEHTVPRAETRADS